jgi:hypothetical protein
LIFGIITGELKENTIPPSNFYLRSQIKRSLNDIRNDFNKYYYRKEHLPIKKIEKLLKIGFRKTAQLLHLIEEDNN